MKKQLVGRKFGRLTVVSEIPERQGRRVKWNCLCECGQETQVVTGHLTGGRIRSCGCLQKDFARSTKRNKLGQRFGRLTVIGETSHRKNGKVVWLCQCECGATKELSSLELCTVVSCGCYRKEVTAQLKYSHGMAAKGSKGYKQYIALSRKQRTPPWADLHQIREIYERCPDGMEVDHIVPILGVLVSGLHVPCNLQYLPKSENISKHNRFTPQVLSASQPYCLPGVYWG